MRQRVFRFPLPTGDNHDAKEAPHVRAAGFPETRRIVYRNDPWDALRHVTHVRCRAPEAFFRLQSTSAGFKMRHTRARA